MILLAEHTITYGNVVMTVIGLIVTGFIPWAWKMNARMATFEAQLNGMPRKVRHLSEDIVQIKTKMQMNEAGDSSIGSC